jgi:NADH:ubiquinone oxidoreductase subunit E
MMQHEWVVGIAIDTTTSCIHPFLSFFSEFRTQPRKEPPVAGCEDTDRHLHGQDENLEVDGVT